MTAIRTSKLLVIVLFLAASAAWASSGDDGIDLRCNKVAGTGDVALQWTNGLTPFSVFRSTNVTDVTTPASYLGQTAGSSWVDTPPAGSLYFYFIAGSCNYAPPEICDGLDNDCDPGTPDGSEDPALGAPCDGADSDLCAEGVTACSSGALKCSDGSASTIDVCDGADNDCDASSSDGSEERRVGKECSELCRSRWSPYH